MGTFGTGSLPLRFLVRPPLHMQKKSLGKGLSALISGASRRWDGTAPTAQSTSESDAAGQEPSGSEGARVDTVSMDAVAPSPMQPRKHFRDDQLDELVESIREHGVIQPLIVRRVQDRLELIAGERRFRACQRLGLTEVPVIVREATDRDVLEMALIENLQREDLNPIEEAEAYCRLAREFGMKQEEIAQRVGKNRATVANSMRLTDLDGEVKSLLVQGRLSTGHAKAILGLRDAPMQRLIADMVVRQNLTVRETEKRVQRELDEKKPSTQAGDKKPQKTMDAHLAKLQNRLRDRLSTHVMIHHGDKKGRIEIEYYGNDDLGRVLEVLGIQAE